jgi:hypothetical protein
MRLRLGRAILVAVCAATVGCAARPAPAPAPSRDAPAVALASPNLRLLAERRGIALDADDLVRRNDPPRRLASTEEPREVWIMRDVRDRQDVVGGRTRMDNRSVTRLREWWQF